jgi:hypothetical protein
MFSCFLTIFSFSTALTSSAANKPYPFLSVSSPFNGLRKCHNHTNLRQKNAFPIFSILPKMEWFFLGYMSVLGNPFFFANAPKNTLFISDKRKK